MKAESWFRACVLLVMSFGIVGSNSRPLGTGPAPWVVQNGVLDPD